MPIWIKTSSPTITETSFLCTAFSGNPCQKPPCLDGGGIRMTIFMWSYDSGLCDVNCRNPPNGAEAFLLQCLAPSPSVRTIPQPLTPLIKADLHSKMKKKPHQKPSNNNKRKKLWKPICADINSDSELLLLQISLKNR